MLVLILIFLFSQTQFISTQAAVNKTYFAQIMFDNVYLFKSPNDIEDNSNIFFELPRTYFVELLESENSTFYKVNYLNFTGYVKKDCVQAIAGIPTCPYLENIHFRIYSELSRDLRSEPNLENGTSGQITYIPLFTRNLTYYGKIYGEVLIDGRTNVWYYCKYSAEQDYYGYVYSDFCDEMTTITENTEKVSYIDNPNFNLTDPINTSYTISQTDNNFGIIVAILTIPAIAFLFMIVKGKHIFNKEKLKDKEIIDY